MDKERNIGFWDRKRLWLEKNRPGKSKHALVGANYDLKDVGPFAVDLSGAPIYKKTLGAMSLILAYVVYWFWYGWVNRGFIDYALLERMTWGAFVGGLAVLIVIITMLIDYHKGSFTPYKRILELRLRTVDRQPLKRVEFKVRTSVELYNPVSGGYWRSEEYREEVEKEISALTVALDGASQLGAALHEEPKAAKILGAAEKKIADLEAELALLQEKFKPVELKDEDMPFALLEGKRFHSIRDMKQIMDIALGKGEVIRTKDEVKSILALKRRFVELAEKIRLPFVATITECDSKGGVVYPLFISKYSLFGGSSGLGSFVEFRDHTLAQRTWAGIMSKENVRAAVGEGVELGMYKFYELVPDEFALLGKKEEKMRFAPVIFVTASDAQAEKMIENFRHNDIREMPVQQDLIDASVIYDSSVADELFETNKLITARLKRKEKSEKEMYNDMQYESKDTIDKGLEKSLIIEKAGAGGFLRNINLFSHKSVKYLFYIVAVVGTVLLLLYVLHYYAGINLGWLFPDRMPGNETVTDDPWGNIITPLRSWFA
jgi:hypothetical protein